MLVICQRCRSAYNSNQTCPHCSFWEEWRLVGHKTEKVIEPNSWLTGSFEDFGICNEKWGFSYYVLTESHNIDSRFDKKCSPRGTKNESYFKLSLNSNRNIKIKIDQTPPFLYKGHYVVVRKPYIGVVFEEDSEERYIPFDVFKMRPNPAYNDYSNGIVRKTIPALYNQYFTYESMYRWLMNDKYKKFKLVFGNFITIDGFIFVDYVFFVENKMP